MVAGGLGRLGRPEGPGTIEGARLPPAVIEQRGAAQRAAARALGASAAKSILFGDLHFDPGSGAPPLDAEGTDAPEPGFAD